VHSEFSLLPAFRHRIGFTPTDARQLYDAMCATDAWTFPSSGTSKLDVLIHNAMTEVLRGACDDWQRWFGGISRRRVELTYMKTLQHQETMGKMIECSPKGGLLQLAVPRARQLESAWV
jgi:hypothetical protein